MRLPIFVLLLGLTLVGTTIALRLATTVSRRQNVEFATALAGGTAITWVLVGIAAFNVVSVSNGTEIANSYPSLGALSVVGVGVSILILAKGSIELLQ